MPDEDLSPIYVYIGIVTTWNCCLTGYLSTANQEAIWHANKRSRNSNQREQSAYIYSLSDNEQRQKSYHISEPDRQMNLNEFY